MIPSAKSNYVYLLIDWSRDNNYLAKLDIDIIKIRDLLRYSNINFDMK
jgi:hypothetical protein